MPGHAVVHREPGVLGRQQALHDDRQRGPAADLVDVGPGQRGVHEPAEELAERRVVDVVAGEVAERPGRLEGVSQVARPVAVAGHVHGHDDRPIAGGLGSLHVRSRHATVHVDVQLEPADPVRRRLGDRLDRAVRQRREDERQPELGEHARPTSSPSGWTTSCRAVGANPTGAATVEPRIVVSVLTSDTSVRNRGMSRARANAASLSATVTSSQPPPAM